MALMPGKVSRIIHDRVGLLWRAENGIFRGGVANKRVYSPTAEFTALRRLAWKVGQAESNRGCTPGRGGHAITAGNRVGGRAHARLAEANLELAERVVVIDEDQGQRSFFTDRPGNVFYVLQRA